MHYAAKNGKTEIVELLLAKKDIDVNIKDNDGETPLHKAVEVGVTEIVKLLLSKENIDMNARDSERLEVLPLHLLLVR